MWSDMDKRDMALSFQEKSGCDEIWEKICEVNFLFFSFFLCVYIYICIQKTKQKKK